MARAKMLTEVTTSLLQRFQREADLQWFLNECYPIQCEIPDDREPEFGILFDRMETAHRIEATLASHPHIRFIGEPIPHDGFLVSLPQDTVDEDGLPTHMMNKLGLENRRRFNFNALTRTSTRFDVSIKTAGKDKKRKEYDAPAAGFDTGLIAASKKAAVKHPGVNLITPSAYRVGGTCLASRSSTNFAYMLSDKSACITFETNDDACAIATPHADILIGYRKEKEPEAISVHLADGQPRMKGRVHEVLDQGIDELKTIVMSESYSDTLSFATESKGAHTLRMAKDFYEAHGVGYDGYDGADVALLQNVIAKTFLGKSNNLFFLSQTIPSSMALSNASMNTNYDDFFPTRTESPKNNHPRLQIARVA